MKILSLLYNSYFIAYIICVRDEYFPKRLLTTNLNESTFIPHLDDTTSLAEYNAQEIKVKPCDIVCFIQYDDMVNCLPQRSDNNQGNKTDTEQKRQPIQCTQDVATGEIIMGHKESVRGLLPNKLKQLLRGNIRRITRTGELGLHLNLNMILLGAQIFTDLGNLITELRLLNTVYMHPDSLIELRLLRSFEIDSDQIPLYFQTSQQVVSHSTPIQPAYMRLKPLDLTQPISFNLNTTCHRCLVDTLEISRAQSADETVIIVAFTRTDSINSINRDRGRISPTLSLLFPNTCPIISNGIGCPPNQNLPKYKNYSNVNHDNNNNNNNKTLSQYSVNGSTTYKNSSSITNQHHTQTSVLTNSKIVNHISITIVLSIWCTIITLLFATLISFVYYCYKKYFKSIHLKSLQLYEPQQRSNVYTDEISSHSTLTGDFNNNHNANENNENNNFIISNNNNNNCYRELKKSNRNEKCHPITNNHQTDQLIDLTNYEKYYPNEWDNTPISSLHSSSVYSLQDRQNRTRHLHQQHRQQALNYPCHRTTSFMHQSIGTAQISQRSIGSQTDFKKFDYDQNICPPSAYYYDRQHRRPTQQFTNMDIALGSYLSLNRRVNQGYLNNSAFPFTHQLNSELDNAIDYFDQEKMINDPSDSLILLSTNKPGREASYTGQHKITTNFPI